jgi:hypothetical protein
MPTAFGRVSFHVSLGANQDKKENVYSLSSKQISYVAGFPRSAFNLETKAQQSASPNWTRKYSPQTIVKFYLFECTFRYFISGYKYHGRSRWQSGLRHVRSSLARKPGSWVRISHKKWMFGMFMCLFCVCVVLCLGSDLATSWSLVQGGQGPIGL